VRERASILRGFAGVFEGVLEKVMFLGGELVVFCW
jgi:hypothetical protein